MGKDKKSEISKKLKGFDIKIDSFGEIKSNMKIDEINKFLNKTVDDKKLRDREDLDEIKEEEE